MAVETLLDLVGLATDPNPHRAGSSGGLREALEVVIDLPGQARRRPPFDLVTEKTGTDYRPRSIHRFREDTYATSYDGSAWRVERQGAVLTGPAVPLDLPVSSPQWLEGRESLYHTNATGLRKIEAGAGSATAASGVDFVAVWNQDGILAGLGGPFTAPASWAYRLVGVKKDANGYVRRSAPTTRAIGAGGAGTKIQGGERIYFSGLAAGDLVEAYRTRLTTATTDTPAPDHYLSWTHTITSAEVTATYFTAPEDVLADDDLGASLYTNPSREGILGGKEIPPVSVALASFASCSWFGNTLSKHRLELALTDVGGAFSTYRTDTGVQCRRFTGDFTLDSANILNVASVVGLVVGQALVDTTHGGGPTAAGTVVKADTKIVAITGAGPYTVQMSNTAASTAAATNCDACDVLLVGGVEFYAYRGSLFGVPTAVGTAARCFIVSTDADYSTRIGITASYLHRAISYYGIANPSTFPIRSRVIGDADYTSGAAGQLLLEEVGIGGASFSVQCVTRPNAWAPTLATAITSVNDRRPGRLWWSDPDEPEAVPLLNYVDVGSQVDPIYALSPLNASLLVWKRDGLFRVSGVAPDGWRVDVVDPSLRILRGECVDTLDGVAYAWTNRGVVAVSETGGIRSISGGLIDSQLIAKARPVLEDSETRGAFVVCSRARRLVLVGMPEESGGTLSDQAYVWSAVTEAWTRWAIPSYCWTYDRVDERLYYAHWGGAAEWELRVDAGSAAEARGYDRAHSLSGWTATAGSVVVSVTVAQAGTWYPRAGDWLVATVDGVVYRRRILSVVNGSPHTLTLATAYPAGSTTVRGAREGIVCRLEWQALSPGHPSRSALFRSMSAHFHGAPAALTNASPMRIGFGARSDVLAAAVTNYAAPERGTVISRPVPAAVSRRVGRAHHCYLSLEVSELEWDWRLAGLGFVAEPISEKVRQ